MNLVEDIRRVLEESGWSATHLAKEAGVAPPIITRLLSGERKEVRSGTLQRLWPFLYGEKRPAPADPEAPEEARA